MASKSRTKPARRAPSAPSRRDAGARSSIAAPDSRSWWIAGALVILTVAVYAGVWSFEFVHFDDPEYIINNRAIAAGLNAASLQWAFTTGYIANWHPITWVSHAIDVSLFGVTAGGPHLVNLLMHLCSTLLLFWFFLQTTGSAGRSAVVAALFAIHPLHVESVAWVSERKDVLSGLFWMLTMCGYLLYVRRPTLGRYGLVLVALALGLMAKQMLVTLPLALLLLDVWPLGRLPLAGGQPVGPQAWRLVREKLPMIALVVLASIMAYLAQKHGGTVTTTETSPIPLRMENALLSYVTYLVNMVWPAGLFMYYPHADVIPMWKVIGCASVLLAITAGVIVFVRTRPYLAVGWFWYLGTLVPVIGLVQLGRHARADRFTYIPLIGIFVLIVWGVAEIVSRWPARRWALPLAAALVVLPAAVVARAQVQTWRDDRALWTHALKSAMGLDDHRAELVVADFVAENNFVPLQTLLFADNRDNAVFPPLARNFLGQTFARHNQLDEAATSLSEAIALAPAVADFHVDFASVLARQHKTDDAIAHYKEAIRLNAGLAQAHTDLAILYAGQKKLDDAIPHFADAARLLPDSPDAHRNLATALGNAGRIEEAVKEFREVLRLKPDDENARRIVQTYGKGR